MNEVWAATLLFFTSFITLINPLGVMPVFLSMTANLEAPQRRNTAIKAVLTAFLVLILFAIGGKFLFDFFNISVSGLKVVGGIIFFMLGYDMLNARLSRIKLAPEEVTDYVNDVSITPLGIPMLAGPGAITNAVILWDGATGAGQQLALILSILAVCLVVLTVFLSASKITRILGDIGNKVLMKLMGLIVMVIAVEFFFDGIKPYVKAILA